MSTRIPSGCLAIGLLLTPLAFAANPPAKKKSTMSEDMRQAIAFEHRKELAAARQARLEAVHPSVTYNNADRSATIDDSANRAKSAGRKK
ncbi:MAG TPA: hypothetical protein VGS58_15025 [Candidatus Sulfopaludibacter sp.]|nr:hypothetical protein [Candidatus Sulfopaludibacter sp.]